MSRFMAIFTDTGWTLVGFIIFMVLFSVFVITTFLPSQVKLHRYLEKLPLNDDESGESALGKRSAQKKESISRGQHGAQI